jgi:hypothetical protein
MEQQHKFRKDLQNRKITPSLDSWDRLNEKISMHGKEQKRKKWYYIRSAAAVILFISIGYYSFQYDRDIIVEPMVVSPTIKNPAVNEHEVEIKPVIEVTALPIKTDTKTENIAQVQPKSKSKTVDKNAIMPEESTVDEKELELPVIEEKVLVSTEITMDNKVDEKLSEEEQMNAEVDQLLKNSRIALLSNRSGLKKTTVNPKDLLFDVEEELDKDLKERIFETVVKMLKNPKVIASTDSN